MRDWRETLRGGPCEKRDDAYRHSPSLGYKILSRLVLHRDNNEYNLFSLLFSPSATVVHCLCRLSVCPPPQPSNPRHSFSRIASSEFILRSSGLVRVTASDDCHSDLKAMSCNNSLIQATPFLREKTRGHAQIRPSVLLCFLAVPCAIDPYVLSLLCHIIHPVACAIVGTAIRSAVPVCLISSQYHLGKNPTRSSPFSTSATPFQSSNVTLTP